MFAGRASPLTGNPRSAANPANAILNYLYALLEAEARFACLAMGLDPGLGVLHADLRARDSLALDVMEAVRPEVDAYLLELLRRRVFRGADFAESRQGGCRVLAPLTHELAETLPAWRGRIAPVVERVAQRLAADRDPAQRPLPTVLTGSRRSAGDTRAEECQAQSRLRPCAPGAEHVESNCRTRGVPTAMPACPPSFADQVDDFRARGAARLAELRSSRADPGHTSSANAVRAAKRKANREAEREWETTHDRPDPSVFREQILPSLGTVSGSAIALVTGSVGPYCDAILRGERVPHPRWWKVVERMGPTEDRVRASSTPNL